MRIALVSRYSWTYPGGVTRHIEALAQQYIAAGHEVRVLAPYDPADLTSAVMHRGATPQPGGVPDYLVSRSGARSAPRRRRGLEHLFSAVGMARVWHELSTGGHDVADIHEPVAPMVGGGDPAVRCAVGRDVDRTRPSACRRAGHVFGRRRCATGCACGSPSRRRRCGPGGVGSGPRPRTPNGVDLDEARSMKRLPRPVHEATCCGIRSPVRPSSAEACRCRCAPSRCCASI